MINCHASGLDFSTDHWKRMELKSCHFHRTAALPNTCSNIDVENVGPATTVSGLVLFFTISTLTCFQCLFILMKTSNYFVFTTFTFYFTSINNLRIPPSQDLALY